MRLFAQEGGGDRHGDHRHHVQEDAGAVRPQVTHALDPQERREQRREYAGVEHQRQVVGIERRRRRQQEGRQQEQRAEGDLRVQRLPRPQRQRPQAQQHAIQRIGQRGHAHQQVARIGAHLQQPGRIALADQQRQAGQRHQAAQQRHQRGPLAQHQRADHDGEQRDHGGDDAHVGGGGGRRGHIGQPLVQRHRQAAQHGQLGPMAQDLGALRPGARQGEGREQRAGQRPAIEADGGGRDEAGGHLGDDHVDRPDQGRQQREEQVTGGRMGNGSLLHDALLRERALSVGLV